MEFVLTPDSSTHPSPLSTIIRTMSGQEIYKTGTSEAQVPTPQSSLIPKHSRAEPRARWPSAIFVPLKRHASCRYSEILAAHP